MSDFELSSLSSERQHASSGEDSLGHCVSERAPRCSHRRSASIASVLRAARPRSIRSRHTSSPSVLSASELLHLGKARGAIPLRLALIGRHAREERCFHRSLVLDHAKLETVLI